MVGAEGEGGRNSRGPAGLSPVTTPAMTPHNGGLITCMAKKPHGNRNIQGLQYVSLGVAECKAAGARHVVMLV